MTRTALRIFSGLILLVLIVLLARTIAYALQPSAAARSLGQGAGGPAFPILVLVALALASAIAIAVCRLAALAVDERALLETRTLAAPLPRLRVLHVVISAIALAVVTSLAGGLLEAYLHWRAGMGWHGLHCVFGPVHRNLIPIEAALSLVAAASAEAARHVVAWMRRTFARLRPVPAAAWRGPVIQLAPLAVSRCRPRLTASAPRAPPVFS
jgi:hypothetical protein